MLMSPASLPSASHQTAHRGDGTRQPSQGADIHAHHLPSAPSGPTRPATPAQASATRTGAPPAAGPDRPRASGTPGWWLPVALLLGIGHAFTFAPWGHGWLQLLVLTGFSLLLASPAIQALRMVGQQFPVLRVPSIVEKQPRMQPGRTDWVHWRQRIEENPHDAP